MVEKKIYRFYSLGLSTTNYGFIYGSTFCLPVVMLMVMQALKLSYSEVSLFLTIYGIVWCFGMYPAGWLTERLGIKSILSFGTALNGLCLIIWSLAPPYPIMCILFGLVGLGAALTWPASVSLVTTWFPPEEHGRALGIMNGGGIGILLILYSLATPAIAERFGWTGPFIIFSILLFMWVAIFLLAVKLPQKHLAESPDDQGHLMAPQQSEQSAFRNLGVWVIGAMGACYMTQYYVFLLYLPSYLQEICRFSLARAGLASMLFIVANIPAGIVGGFVADRIGILKTQIIGCLISASAIIMAIWVIKDWKLLIPVLFLIGWGPYFALGPYYGLASLIVSPDKEASAIGLISFLQWSPGMYVPVLAGWTLQLTSSYVPMFLLATVFPLVGVILCLFGKRYTKVREGMEGR